MFKIIAFTAADSDDQHVVDSAIKIAAFFNVQVEFLHYVQGPSEWNLLSRTAKDKHPDCKVKIANARDKFDGLLRDLRSCGVTASKRIIVQETLDSAALICNSEDLLLWDSKSFWKLDIANWIKATNIMLLSTFIDPRQFNDLVVNSCFQKPLKQVTLDLILRLSNQIDLHKHFLFVNTQKNFESSSNSVNRIKKSINQSGFNKTRIEVFNSQRHDEGIAEFSKLKNCDLIIIEYIKASEISNLARIEVPLILIKS